NPPSSPTRRSSDLHDEHPSHSRHNEAIADRDRQRPPRSDISHEPSGNAGPVMASWTPTAAGARLARISMFRGKVAGASCSPTATSRYYLHGEAGLRDRKADASRAAAARRGTV